MNNSIYPCIWCNNNASEMADFYAKVFNNTKKVQENPVVTMIEIEGQKMMLLNGGDYFKPNASISFLVNCVSADEVVELWDKLADEGISLMPLDSYPFAVKYGWVMDKYGVTWQLYYNDKEISQRFTPTLMFLGKNNGKCAEAIEFYTNTFPNSGNVSVMKYSEGTENYENPDNIQHAQFEIDKYMLMAMDSSYEHQFNFTEGISLVIECKHQQEIDYFWNKLPENGGEESQCGWVKDKYGVSWQIVPENLGQILAKYPNAMAKLMKMKRIIISELEQD